MTVKYEKYIGQRFNGWVVEKFVDKDKYGNLRFSCRCDCGREKDRYLLSLRDGTSKGCHHCSAKYKKRSFGKKHGKDLYLVGLGDHLKIGSSSNVKTRLSALQSSSPKQMEVLYHGVGEGHLEPILQEIFERYHVRGEWYSVRKWWRKHGKNSTQKGTSGIIAEICEALQLPNPYANGLPLSGEDLEELVRGMREESDRTCKSKVQRQRRDTLFGSIRAEVRDGA